MKITGWGWGQISTKKGGKLKLLEDRIISFVETQKARELLEAAEKDGMNQELCHTVEYRKNELLCAWLAERTKGRKKDIGDGMLMPDEWRYEVADLYSWPRRMALDDIPFEILQYTRHPIGVEPKVLAPFTRSLDSIALVVGAMTDSEREYYRHLLIGESGAWLGEGAIDGDAQTRSHWALVALGLWETSPTSTTESREKYSVNIPVQINNETPPGQAWLIDSQGKRVEILNIGR